MIGLRAVESLVPPAPRGRFGEGIHFATAAAATRHRCRGEVWKSGGTEKVRVKISSPVSVWGTSVTAKSSTL